MKFYVGDYTHLGGPGAALCELDGDVIRLIETAAEVKDPSYVILTRDQKTLYVTGESGGEAAAFNVSDGHLRFVSRQSTGGKGSCHLTLSDDERFLYVANYSSGSLTVFPVDGAQISPQIQLIQHEGHGPNAVRQERAHVHFVSFDTEDRQLLCAVDLGIDAVMMYRQNPETGLLTYEKQLNVPAGFGPRHLIFHGKDMMYVAHELENAVSACRRTENGWEIIQTLTTLPEGWQGANTVAAIRLHENRLFVSNRGYNSLAVYTVQPDGTLAAEGIYPTHGVSPRDFAVLPDGKLLVSHQDSGDVRLFELNDGLQQLGETFSLPGAVCVRPIAE